MQSHVISLWVLDVEVPTGAATWETAGHGRNDNRAAMRIAGWRRKAKEARADDRPTTNRVDPVMLQCGSTFGHDGDTTWWYLDRHLFSPYHRISLTYEIVGVVTRQQPSSLNGGREDGWPETHLDGRQTGINEPRCDSRIEAGRETSRLARLMIAA